MTKPNKYHSSGREYTAGELADRRLASAPVYLVYGYSTKPLERLEQGKLSPVVNTSKRSIQAARAARPKGVSK